MDTNKMSSEVEEKQELTEGAADTEKKTPAEEELTVPLHAHTALRGRAQAAELDAANLRGRIEGMQQAQAEQAPATKSPIELEIARQAEEGVDEEDMSITPSLYRKQQIYDQQVANKQVETKTAQKLAETQGVSVKASKIEHTDWQDVIDAGEKLLSRGEHLDITTSGEGFGEIAYAKCQAAIERNKPEKETSAAPEKKPGEQEAKEKEAEEKKKAEEAPSQADILANASAATVVAFKL